MMSLLCVVRGHRRRRSVWNDGLEFRSSCRSCGTPMLRDGRTGKWRMFDRVKDYDIAREGRDTRK